jgi:hypothetical protein
VREVLELLLLSAKGTGPEERFLLPPHFALARPGGKSLKNSMSEADAGYSGDHPHAGYRAAAPFACGFLRADGTPCGCKLWVRVKDGVPGLLFVNLERKAHRHKAGFCPDTGQPCAPVCLSRGFHPTVQPTGVPPRLYAAALLVRVQSWMQGRDAGVPTAPAAVLRGAVNLAPPLVCLSRDETRYGTSRSWEDVLLFERQRVLLARALASRAPLMLMDEPLAHLDAPHQVDWLEQVHCLRAQGTTVLSVLHEVGMALQADEIVVMGQGRVLHHGASQDPATHAAIEAVLEHRVRICAVQDQWVVVPRLTSGA